VFTEAYFLYVFLGKPRPARVRDAMTTRDMSTSSASMRPELAFKKNFRPERNFFREFHAPGP
jgi:hypothetical protein